MLDYHLIPVTAFQQNCTLLWCTETREAVVTDPGGEVDNILATIEKLKLRIKAIILTHGHLDHVGAAPDLASKLNLPIIGPGKEDQFWLDALPQQAALFGFPPIKPFQPHQWLKEGDQIDFGHHQLRALHCPGHTPGHMILLEEQARLAVVGDVLFQGSIGRTDFPKGNHSQLIHSIRHKLFPLGDDIRFIPGHGPMSTFGHERQYNPMVFDKTKG